MAVRVGISQIVHVVSMLEVMIRLGEMVFQSNAVMGAVCSGDFEFERRARGDSFAGGLSLWLEGRVIEFDVGNVWELGKDHKRR